jgi:hypothetical protein
LRVRILLLCESEIEASICSASDKFADVFADMLGAGGLGLS